MFTACSLILPASFIKTNHTHQHQHSVFCALSVSCPELLQALPIRNKHSAAAKTTLLWCWCSMHVHRIGVAEQKQARSTLELGRVLYSHVAEEWK